MRERDIEKAYRKQVEARGGMCVKLSSQHFNGLPDRLIVLPENEIYFVEFKSNTGKLSRRQERVISKLIALGARVEVISEI